VYLLTMKLKHKRLADITLVPVETRSKNKFFRVDRGLWQAGFVEKFAARPGEIHPWKAFRGIGHKAQFVTAFYENEGGLDAAVACVLDRSQ